MGKPNDDLNNMMCLDVVHCIGDADFQQAVQKVKARHVFPLMSWDLSGSQFGNSVRRRDANRIHQFSKQFGWQLEADKILGHYYEALVLTDVNQSILWTNEGFTTMTGYEAVDAIGKTPKFLQGENTSEESRLDIKSKLLNKTTFSGVIVNYRKNRTEYLCEIRIIPIHNFQNEVTHFIALEKAI